MEGENDSLEVFLPGCVFEHSLDDTLLTMEMLEEPKVRPTKATGLQKRAVQN